MNRSARWLVLPSLMLLPLTPARVDAQAGLDLAATGGLGYYNAAYTPGGEQGLAGQVSLGIPISGSLAIAPQVSFWQDGGDSFVVIAPELRWAPPTMRWLQLSAGVGRGREKVRVLCTTEVCAYSSGRHERQTTVVGSLGASVGLPTAGLLQPLIQFRMMGALGTLTDSRHPDVVELRDGRAMLVSVGLGFRVGRP